MAEWGPNCESLISPASGLVHNRVGSVYFLFVIPLMSIVNCCIFFFRVSPELGCYEHFMYVISPQPNIGAGCWSHITYKKIEANRP